MICVLRRPDLRLGAAAALLVDLHGVLCGGTGQRVQIRSPFPLPLKGVSTLSRRGVTFVVSFIEVGSRQGIAKCTVKMQHKAVFAEARGTFPFFSFFFFSDEKGEIREGE